MSKDFESVRWMRALVGSLCLSAAWPAIGQPATYDYDRAGNATGAVPGGSGAPTIIVPPQSELMDSNSPATFSVGAAGWGLSYQWLSNGIAILGATGDSLVVGNLPLVGTNLGNFSVVVSNVYGAVTSTPAALWPDANGNGIPDWWEIYYFGNLNQRASGDFDADGVSNLNEYLEGANPTNSRSFNPRLYVQSVHGSVTVSPLLPYYTNGQFVTLTAFPDPGRTFVGWSGDLSGTKAQINVVIDTNKTAVARFGLPLSVALDNSNLVWTTGGDATWFGQADVSHDGLGAGQSGTIVAYYDGANFVGQKSWLQAVTNNNQTLQISFWWAASCQPPDALTFSVDGTNYASITGEALGWQFIQTNILAGNHTLTWTYSKGPVDVPTGITFLDSAWLDQVSLAPTNTTPPSPLLDISLTTSNSVLVSWPTPSAGFILQQNDSLSPTNWVNSTNPVIVAGSRNQVIVVPSVNRQFYRLIFQ